VPYTADLAHWKEQVELTRAKREKERGMGGGRKREAAHLGHLIVCAALGQQLCHKVIEVGLDDWHLGL
jgi:hypothetical protein